MFKIVNDRTGSTIFLVEEYETAVKQMSNLNCSKGWRHKARSWVSGIERELCVKNGTQEYGKYIIRQE